MATNSKICTYCRSETAELKCGPCGSDICKSCTEFVSADRFSFMNKIPDELRHTHYCTFCHSTTILPALTTYASLMKQAKEVFIIEKPPRKPLPILKRSTATLIVKECDDREETVLRLAFLAAELGFNSVIKTKISYTKVRNAGYQKMVWSGAGIPVDLDSRKL